MILARLYRMTFFGVIVFNASQVQSQQYLWAPDSISKADPGYSLNSYHETLHYNDPLMYLVFPVAHPVVKRKIPLKEGEGKDGFWLEGNLGYRFTIYKGKFYSAPVWQRLRMTLDVSLHSMLTRDESSPILPFNNKVGIGLDYLISGLSRPGNENKKMVWTTFQLHHYSNGQADTFFLDTPEKRNNYRSGNFSTNYFRVMLNMAGNKKNLLITSFGYQKEVDIGGPLGSSTELKNYYGDGRILLQLNWTKKPWLITRQFINRGSKQGGMIDKDVRRQLGVRTEFEYITGDLSAFPGINKQRLGWHTYLTYMPSVNNEVGFMAHTYLGRHYLNIRFDDIVFIAGLGLYVRFNGK